jgi:hypothetical protein
VAFRRAGKKEAVPNLLVRIRKAIWERAASCSVAKNASPEKRSMTVGTLLLIILIIALLGGFSGWGGGPFYGTGYYGGGGLGLLLIIVVLLVATGRI